MRRMRVRSAVDIPDYKPKCLWGKKNMNPLKNSGMCDEEGIKNGVGDIERLEMERRTQKKNAGDDGRRKFQERRRENMDRNM